MNPQSAKALAWTAGILIILAPAIISASGSFPLLVLAAICAAVPSVFAANRTRIISTVLLIISMALAASFYPDFVSEQISYRQHAQERATKLQVTMPTDQGAKKE